MTIYLTFRQQNNHLFDQKTEKYQLFDYIQKVKKKLI